MDEKQIHQLKVDLLNFFDKALRDALFRAALPPEANYVNWSDKKIAGMDEIKPMSLPANLELVAEEFKSYGIPFRHRRAAVKPLSWDDLTDYDKTLLRGMQISII